MAVASEDSGTRKDEMTPEQQRIVIAEACGWKQNTHDARLWSKDGRTFYTDNPGRWLGTAYIPLPDYPNDLNAMHEAEKYLRPPYWNDYSIWQIYFNYFEEDPHATAAQRSEAFLRTLGKWKE